MSAADGRRARLDGLALAVLVTCCALWGLNQVAVKVALADVPPLTQLAVRSLGAAVLVLAWARLRGVTLFARDGTGRAGLAAGLLFGAEFACIFVGLQYTSASRMTVFLYLAPFLVALGMPFIARGERLAAPQWAGLVIAFGGVAAAFAEGLAAPLAGPRQWLGDTLGVAAAVLWASTTLVIRAGPLSQASAEKTLLYQLAISGLLLAALAAASGPALPRPLSALAIGSLVFQTVVVAFASFLAWFWLVRHYPATRLASFTLLTPVAGLLFGVLLLSEPLTVPLLTGLSAVVAGIVLVNRR
jgi:drug/metabolite transporter (DMT)-like permease